MRDLPIIQLRDASLSLNGRAILRGVSWELRAGEHWLFVGANGSGKSSLLRVIRGEQWLAPGDGERIYDLDGTPTRSAIGARERIGLVSAEGQEAYVRNGWNVTAREAIWGGFFNLVFVQEAPSPERVRRAEELAARLGVGSLLDRGMLELSQGEARKVLIARALAPAPRVLLLDEPCNGLDAASRRGFLSFINDAVCGEASVVLATHNEEEAFARLTHALRMEEGRIVEKGEIGGGVGCARQDATEKDKENEKEKDGGAESVNGGGGEAEKGAAVILLSGVAAYLGDHRAVDGLDWALGPGENWTIVGANGSGKSTLLKLVAGELHPVEGTIERFGSREPMNLWELRRRIAFVGPELQSNYLADATGEEVVISGIFSSVGIYDEIEPRHRETARQWIEFFGLQALAPRRFLELSYGQRRLLLIARAMAGAPQILLLDEPCDGLDSAARASVLAAIDAAALAGVQFVHVTHRPEERLRMATHAARMEGGRIVKARAIGAPWAKEEAPSAPQAGQATTSPTTRSRLS